MTDEALPPRKEGLIGLVVALWDGLYSFVFRVVPLLLAAAFVLLLLREMRRQDIEIAPIQVPTRLAEAGLSPDVVALRLLDQVVLVQNTVTAERLGQQRLELAGDQPDFNVPIAGLSLRALAALLRSVFGTPSRRITGEIVLEKDQLKLRLRLAGHGLIADTDGVAADAVDQLLARAAPEIWRVIQPRLYAWHVAQNEPNQAIVRDRLRALLRSAGGDLATENTARGLMGRSYLREGRARDAFDVAEIMINANPELGAAWYLRGLAQFRLGRVEAALEDYRRAQQLDPRAIWVHVALAEGYSQGGRLDEALGEIRKALALQPRDPWALFHEGQVLLAMNRTREAMLATRRGLDQDSNSADLRLLLGRVWLKLGNPTEAISAFEQAARLAPAMVEPVLDLAEVLISTGKSTEARDALTKLLTREDLPDAQRARAEALMAR
ncbi:MAG: tetratricopeptide repeat protein [Alphaproteobacteria bacterium]|nr:tetratricopeptide repeat protein [Alphaproteobacteria bacterium]